MTTLMLLLPFLALSTVDDWPGFLGPHRNGISAESNLLETWPEGGLKEQWRTPLGTGMSGIVVVDQGAYTMYQDSENQFVVKLDTKTGDVVWKTSVAPRFRNQMGAGPRATPAIIDEQLFALTGEGFLVAIELGSGEVLWKAEPLKELGGREADYGMASSPLIVDDQVIVIVGGDSGNVAAYQRDSGKLSWATGKGTSGYSSPTLVTLNGKQQIVAFTGPAVLGLDPNTGEQLWSYPFETDYDCNIATPLVIDNKLFISAGENHGCVLLAINPENKQQPVTVEWESLGRDSVLRNEWQTSILWNDHLYGLDNVGSAGPVTHLSCIDPVEGKTLWQEQRFGKANLVAADGKLFLSTMEGELVVVKIDPERYTEIGRMEVLGPTRQAPTIADGQLYLRDNEVVVCLSVKKD